MFSKYCVPKNSYIYLSNGSNYECHFIIKELPEKIKKQITSLGENTAKYITFIAPIEKWLTRIDRKIDMCLKRYETDPDFFFSAPGLAWRAASKKTTVKLDLLIDIDVLLLMAEKGVKGRICQSAYQYEKDNKKYMKDYRLK